MAAMLAADFNADAGVVTVRDSKAGKPHHVVLTDERATAVRHADGRQARQRSGFHKGERSVWGKSHQLRPMLEACRRARAALRPPAF
jgi:hypothetical protein